MPTANYVKSFFHIKGDFITGYCQTDDVVIQCNFRLLILF